MVRLFIGGDMKVDISQEDDNLIFNFHLEKDDNPHPHTSYSFNNPSVKVDLKGIRLFDIHPDLIALSTILMCHPFVGSRLDYPLPVSDDFQQAMNRVVSRYKLYPKSTDTVAKRHVGDNYRMGLAYSGGVDSNAALSVLPRDTAPVFMLRPKRNKSLYLPSAALESCSLLQEVGYDVRIITCDVEYRRDPVGFPTDLANAIPAILLADDLKLDSISFGTVLESAFGLGHEKYRDYGKGAHWKFYGTLFEAAGVSLSLPVSGISEVGTTMITNTDPIGDFSQSCIRGEWKRPCNRCWKCFRKGVLNSSFGNRAEMEMGLRNLVFSKEVIGKLNGIPISHENILEYALQRINVTNDRRLESVKKRVDRQTDLDFLEKWFHPSLDFNPPKYRRGIKNKILDRICMMDAQEMESVMSWDMGPDLALKSLRDSAEMMNSILND